MDVTSEGLGRNPEGLREISQHTGVKIVMGCGHYRDPYLDRSWIDRTDTDTVAGLIESEIAQGVAGTDIRPGIIGEIAADKWYVSAAEERSFRAAARAQKRTGLTITTHAARWAAVGRAQLAILRHEDVDPRRIIIGHCDTVPDTDYHSEVARGGSYVEYDTIRDESEYELDRVVGYIMNMFKAGLGEQVLISHDVCLTSHLSIHGGPGYDYIPSRFVPRLKVAGLTADDIETLLVHNPRRALTGEG